MTGPAGWFWAWCLFTWLALTSAGPFLFLVRRFFTKPDGYPRLGDRLWGLAGLPWLLAAIIQTLDPSAKGAWFAYSLSLTLGLVLVAIISVPVLAARFLLDDPSRPKLTEPTPWTHRLGIFLAVAWPIQCGVGLVVMG